MKKVLSIFSIILVLVLGINSSANAKNFTPNELQLIAAAQDYISAIETMRANFIQFNPSEVGVVYGEFYLAKPGRALIRYTKPFTIDYYINDENIVQYDYELDQVGRGAAPENPLLVLLYDGIKLLDNQLLELAKVEDIGSSFELQMVTKSEDLSKEVTGLILKFNKTPFELVSIQRVDYEGNKTDMNLSNVKENVELQESLFKFIRPKAKYPSSK